jgi:DNA-binding CsgD family transcriptional regulator/PAS domain-containing protein
MSVRTTGLHQLAAGLQAALTEAEVTRAYLTEVPALIGARGRGFYQLDPETGAPAAVAADVPAAFLSDYEERGRGGDPVLEFVQQNLRPMDNTRVSRAIDWEASPAHDVLRRAGYFHSMEAPVIMSGQFIGTISFARSRADHPFTVADLSAAMQAGEQLGLAMERALRFQLCSGRTSLLEATLDRLAQAIVVTSLDGGVLYSNKAAVRADRGAGQSMLQLAKPQIADAIASFRQDNRRVAVGNVTGPCDDARLIVKSTRLPGEFGAALTLIYPSADKEAAKLPLWEILSAREQQIAEWVSNGLTTRQIAERAVVSENTVKQHLKRIFAKAAVTNRAELVQRIWASRKAPQPDEIG